VARGDPKAKTVSSSRGLGGASPYRPKRADAWEKIIGHFMVVRYY